MIARIHKESRDMIIIHKYPILKDARLSLRAKGLLTYLVGHPNGWEARINEITQHCKDGRESVIAAMKELQTLGYASKTQLRNAKGQIETVRWEIYELPLELREPDAKPESGKPTLVKKTEVGKTEVGKTEVGKTEVGKTEVGKTAPNNIDPNNITLHTFEINPNNIDPNNITSRPEKSEKLIQNIDQNVCDVEEFQKKPQSERLQILENILNADCRKRGKAEIRISQILKYITGKHGVTESVIFDTIQRVTASEFKIKTSLYALLVANRDELIFKDGKCVFAPQREEPSDAETLSPLKTFERKHESPMPKHISEVDFRALNERLKNRQECRG